MKKVLVFLLACFACTAMFAQNTTHWTMNSQGCEGSNCFMRCNLYINGEIVDDVNLEIGAFDGDICRGSVLPNPNLVQGHRYYNITMKGYTGLVYNFRVWDHSTDSERTDLTLAITDVIEYGPNVSYGRISAPYHLNFAMEVSAGIEKNITGYSPVDHWYFLSSPVGSIEDASQVANLTDGTYDLYYFDQTGGDDGKEWRNYKTNAFGFEAGKGYLYANESDVIVTFYGTPYEGDGIFELAYEEEVQDSDMRGWNLMGNPYNESATVSMEQFYVMEGAAMVPNDGNNVVGPMEGIFVKASGAGETVTFVPGEAVVPTSKLSLNLVSNNSLVDRAVVNFGEGSLPKFQINSSSAKLYIPMDGEEYAVVSSEEMGEIPVNFKAERSGSYSLVVSTEMSFNYLHLIDNLTGADVDLLATPSYGFEAVTTDYASRFKLVFATGNSDDTFAFYSNGSFVISNEGEATVQVVDVTGRIMSSEAINGSASISVSGAAGVYMIRLINGDNVKVQKVVVK